MAFADPTYLVISTHDHKTLTWFLAILGIKVKNICVLLIAVGVILFMCYILCCPAAPASRLVSRILLSLWS